MAVQNFGSGGGYQVSPGVNVSEIDLTTVTPSVDTTVGAFAGVFRWGPVNEPVLVTSENDLVLKFGKPTSINPETFFTAASFLSYSNALYISRAANTSAQYAAIGSSAQTSANALYTVINNESADDVISAITTAGVEYIARWPGDLGNSLKVSVCENANQYSQSIDLSTQAASSTNTSLIFSGANTGLALAVGSKIATVTLDGAGVGSGSNSVANSTTLQTDATTVAAQFAAGDYVEVTAGSASQSLKIVSRSSVLVSNTIGVNSGICTFTLTFDQPLKLATAVSTDTVTRYWEYYSFFSGAPGRSTYVEANGNTVAQLASTLVQNDEVHIVVVDEDGGFTGNPGATLEVYQGLSRATDAKNSDGTTNYYKSVINDQSLYIWMGDDHTGADSNTALHIVSATGTAPLTLSLTGGVDLNETSSGVPFADLAKAYDKFVSPEDIDISLVLTGAARGGTHGEQLPNYLIDNIAEVRKDCVVFVSPQAADVVNKATTAEANVVEFRNALRSTSYAVMDSGYKYMYDKYNDMYRWIPLNGDIAGTCVRTDNTRDPWFSPAGSTRGQIRNVIKLAFNPNLAQRNVLYKNGVNSVISQPGQGVILYGDKTLLSKPSAFDRINVRRLFIVLEKAISRAAKEFLFEFNDEFTRAQFRNLVEPFLRDVQGRRGIYDFKVVCDETNNTAQVIDTNRFVGDIYVKPARSINFIQLNFVAVRSGIEFAEIVG